MVDKIKELTKKYSLQVIDGNICSLQKSKMTEEEIVFLKINKSEAIKIIISENAKKIGLPLIAAAILTQQTIDKLDIKLQRNNDDLSKFKTA